MTPVGSSDRFLRLDNQRNAEKAAVSGDAHTTFRFTRAPLDSPHLGVGSWFLTRHLQQPSLFSLAAQVLARAWADMLDH